jgi:pimeloyl-ACP methyl ester carboxylesterase
VQNAIISPIVHGVADAIEEASAARTDQPPSGVNAESTEKNSNGTATVATLVVGFRGAGPDDVADGDTPALKTLVEADGGRMYEHGPLSRWLALRDIEEFKQEHPDGKLVILGYSRGGRSAIVVTNKLGAEGIKVDALITFDPHDFTAEALRLKFDNVGVALNFYQRNPTSWTGGIGFWGSNPYNGRPVTSDYIKVGGHNFTGDTNINHLNIVTESVKMYGENIQKAMR